MPAVLRQAATALPDSTLHGALVAIHAVADPIGQVFADQLADAFERHVADDRWPQFRTVDGLTAYLYTAAADLEVELARELEHARRRQAAEECSSCGRPSTAALCGTCTGSVVTPCRYCNDPAATGFCSDAHRRLDAACETTWRTR
jgi:hypothetical protein